MKKIILIILFFVVATSLKAGLDTIEVKDDYRLYNIFYEPLNDSVIITYLYMLDNPDSVPVAGDYDLRLVNYNINSRSFTHTYEIIDSTQYYPHDFILSSDKSKLMLYTSFNDYGDSLYVFNTNDGSLDSILLMPNYRFHEDVKQLSDGKAGIFAESSSTTMTKWGKSQKYVGQIDLNDYSSTFYPLNPDFENYEEKLINFDIIKSYHNGYDKEVVFHSDYEGNYGYYSAPFDSNLIKRDDVKYIDFSPDSGLFWWNYGLNYENYIEEPIYFQNDRYFVYNNKIYDSKKEYRINSYLRQPVPLGLIMGFNKNEEFVFFKEYLDDGNGGNVSSIIIHDFENDLNVDTLIFRVNPHSVIGSRPYDNIKFLNDSIAVCLIRAGFIKFKFLESTLSTEEYVNENEYLLYPNPTKENIILDFELDRQEQLDWQIIDINGRELIANTGYFAQGNNKIEINVANLENGVYFLKLGNKTSKFVISR